MFGGLYPFITPTDIDGQSRLVKTERFLSEKWFNKQKNYLLPKNTICYVCIGNTIGKTCMTDKLSFSNQQINSVITNENNNPFYIYYLLNFNKNEIRTIAGGAATPIINKSIFSGFKVKVTSLKNQQKIASILSAYDDLIENNNKRIKILEQTAKSIYTDYFLNTKNNFDIIKVSEFGQIITGKTPSKAVADNFNQKFIRFIKTPDLHNNLFCLETTEWLSEKGANSQKNKTIPENSICVSCIGTGGVVSITAYPSQTNQQINTIIPKKEIYLEYLYFSLKDLKQTMLNIGAKGSTMMNLNKAEFGNLDIKKPQDELIEKYHKIVNPVFKLIKNLQIKNLKLTETKNLLLPKLISGELDVEGLDIKIRPEIL